MPERIVETEFVKMTQPGDEKMNSIDDSDKLYCQKRPETLSVSTVDLMTRERAAGSVDTRLTIVGEKDGFSFKPRCSLWMIWLKFSSLLYLIVILMLVLWALHQFKQTQEKKEEELYRLPGQPSTLKSALTDNSGQQSSKALLHYSRHQPTREPEIIEWEKLNASYLIGHDITYGDQRYNVKSSGYYEVQCRLQFDTYTGHVPTQDVHIVFSMIRNTGPESSKNLMSDLTTLRPRERRGIQLGPTVFYLEQGDSVYVSVQQQQMKGVDFVNPTEENYFAMRRIE